MKINGLVANGELKRVYIRQTVNGIYRNELIAETYKTIEQIKKECPARLRKSLVIELA